MLAKTTGAVLLFLALLFSIGWRQKTPPASPLEYTSDGQLKLPEHYRDWVYLTSGFDMSYSAQPASHHIFDNVFVDPAAYRAFQETGAWPDKTVLVLENRGAEGRRSINQHGNYQSTEVMGVELHIKDKAHFVDGWAFFGFGRGQQAKLIRPAADCYSCHSAHGAVDTTFVQFYPTLLPLASSKGTLSTAYKQETAASLTR